jgi:hypothetical protein
MGSIDSLIILKKIKGDQAFERHFYYTTAEEEIQPFWGGSKVFLIHLPLFLESHLMFDSYLRNLLFGEE